MQLFYIAATNGKDNSKSIEKYLELKKHKNLKDIAKEVSFQSVEKTFKSQPKTNNSKPMNNLNNKNDNGLNNENYKIIFGNIYQKEKKINKGLNGTIYKVLDKRDKKLYALKIIDY